MNSNEVLRKTIHKAGVKSIAADMNLSTSLVYKWCQPNGVSGTSGADNPLDRIQKIYQLTGDTAPVTWLCKQVDGYLVMNKSNLETDEQPILMATQRMLNEFSDVLAAVSKGYEDDGRIDSGEAKKIPQRMGIAEIRCRVFRECLRRRRLRAAIIQKPEIRFFTFNLATKDSAVH